MGLLFRLIPHTVLQTSSIYNRDIRVVQEWAGPKLLVNGSRQSGRYIRKLWDHAIRIFGLPKDEDKPTAVLVLGVGGGSVIELLANRLPRAHITAVDIDSLMITIAKQQFGVDKIANVRLVEADANIYVQQCRKQGRYFDIVVVDVFIGRHIPEFVCSSTFLGNLHAIVKSGGSLLINYLRELEYRAKSDELCERLKDIWRYVDDMNLNNNRFFFAHT